MKKKSKNSKGARPRVEVDVAKLDQLVDKTELGPLQQEERSELKSAIHQLATEVARQQEMKKRSSSTEKAKKLMAEHAAILGKGSEPQEDGRAESDEKPKRSGGNGRAAAADYVGATKETVPLADEFKPKAKIGLVINFLINSRERQLFSNVYKGLRRSRSVAPYRIWLLPGNSRPENHPRVWPRVKIGAATRPHQKAQSS